ncbi:hypothetical protein PFISCL1PPCAC_4287, partial [Pristionchus fissidentatus]
LHDQHRAAQETCHDIWQHVQHRNLPASTCILISLTENRNQNLHRPALRLRDNAAHWLVDILSLRRTPLQAQSDLGISKLSLVLLDSYRNESDARA